jgi:hypothetical protein
MPSLSQVIAHGMGNRVVQAFRIWVAENDQYSHVLSFTQRQRPDTRREPRCLRRQVRAISSVSTDSQPLGNPHFDDGLSGNAEPLGFFV